MKRSVSNKSRSEAHPVAARRFRICSWSSEKASSARRASWRANRFEDAVALLQRRAGFARRPVPVNSGWIGTHACAVRTAQKSNILSYPGSSEGSLPLLVRPPELHGCKFSRRRSRQTKATTPISSVIVFRGVPQCPMVHVRLRLGDARPTPRCPHATTLQILPSASIRPIV